MKPVSFQIRVCYNCGLRYPVVDGQSFAGRCPACLGNTIVVAERALQPEIIEEHHADAKTSATALHVLLDNVRSAWNVGAIFRSADGFGFKRAYLCGITPTPENAEVRKTAVGAENSVDWSAHKNGVELVEQLRAGGFEIWALEKTSNSLPINAVLSKRNKLKKVVLVVGNEVTGLDPGILELADYTVHIPMRGQKRSFNVAVAFAVAAQILRSQPCA